MTTFGDIRSVLMTKDLKSLSATMTAYNDPLTPKGQMRHYVKSSLGADKWVEMLALNPRWKSGDCVKQTALEAVSDYREHKPLILMTCGIRRFWDTPERILRRAVLPIRCEAADKYWRPLANEYGFGEINKTIDNCLELTQMWIDERASKEDLDRSRDALVKAARYPIRHDSMPYGLRACMLSAIKSLQCSDAWSAGWHAAQAVASWPDYESNDVWHAAQAAAWSDFCNRVNIAMIKEALL